MMTLKSIIAGVLIATTPLITISAPATAAPLMRGMTNTDTAPAVQQVQYRHYHHGYRHGWHRGGGGAGALIGGLAAGAIIGGAIAAGQANAAAQQNAAYCSRRFRSYDPASGTYLGNDGMRHPCP
jgi:hypothetical protein